MYRELCKEQVVVNIETATKKNREDRNEGREECSVSPLIFMFYMIDAINEVEDEPDYKGKIKELRSMSVAKNSFKIHWI